MDDGVNDLVEVRLLGLPVAVHGRADLHMKGLQRELDLINRRDPDRSSVPHRLRGLVDELTERFGGFGIEASGALADAVERGDTSIDLLYLLPASAGEAARRLGAILDEVDVYCRHGDLLTLITPTEALR
jgi:hypothetical protein